MNNKLTFLIKVCIAVLFFSSCSKDGDLNFFTVSQDIEFGMQLDSTIRANPAEYPILAKSHPAYSYLNNMMLDILDSEEIYHHKNAKEKHQFPWEVTIINDNVKNAFAAPGGKLYFYTGLISYLDSAAHLAGVMAHEIAHSDRRHSTEQLTDQYTFSTLLSILLGNNESTLVQIAGDLALGAAVLQFSQKDEYEADEYSIRYLADTEFHPKGIAGFFEKLHADEYIDDNGNNSSGKLFEFLSTHPSDANRLSNIDEVWKEIGQPGGIYNEQEYEDFKLSLGLK